MTNEKWWLANKQLQHLLTQVRTVEQDVLLDDIIPDIVAEAERMGEVKALDQVIEVMTHEFHYYHDRKKNGFEIHKSLWKAQGIKEVAQIINAKLTELKKV